MKSSKAAPIQLKSPVQMSYMYWDEVPDAELGDLVMVNGVVYVVWSIEERSIGLIISTTQ